MADTALFDSIDDAFDAVAQALPALLGDLRIDIVDGHRAIVIDLADCDRWAVLDQFCGDQTIGGQLVYHPVDTDRFVLELTQDQPS